MKTQILQLEPHDDVISTRDKMGWGQAARVVLVWPKRERILIRKLDLLLLQRHAFKMGAQLALVTSDPDIRFYAHQLAIPVFKNLRQAHSSRWRVGRRPTRSIQRRQSRPDFAALRQEIHPEQVAWYNLPLTRRIFHIISILAVLTLLALFIPSASIRLSPHTQPQEIRFSVSAGSSVQTVNVTGDLPARSVSVIVEGYDKISTTGTLPAPEKSSFGRVQFSNLTDSTVSIPIGIVVSTLPTGEQAPIRFSTTVSANVPSGGSILIGVRCLEAGKQGNLSAGEIIAIEGPLGLKLSVSNPSAMTGGSEQPAAAPTPADAHRLYERLLASLHATALKELSGEGLGQAGLPIDSTLALASTLAKTYTPPFVDGAFTQPAETLALTLRLEFQGLVVSNQDLEDISIRILDANLPKGYLPLPKTLEFEHLSSPVIDEQATARWRMVARRTLKATIDEQQALTLVQGLPPPQAKAALQKGLTIDKVDIHLAPEWWPRLPLLPFRIQILTPP
jgi:hypothetical protein